MTYIYGPIISRRLGRSLGISPIPEKTCNYSCIYCQLGITDIFTNERNMFYPVESILNEFDRFVKTDIPYDVVTIVGEGEPTLYSGLGDLVRGLHERTDKPVAIITNGALLYKEEVASDCMGADIVLPTLDGYDEASFSRINRHHKAINFVDMYDGIKRFSRQYKGELWLEIMLMKGINDDDESLAKYKKLLKPIQYDRLYLNTPIRPPALKDIEMSDDETMKRAERILFGTSIKTIGHETFSSAEEIDLDALLDIFKRHPMNEFEIKAFLKARHHDGDEIFKELKKHPLVNVSTYKGMDVYSHKRK